jgi:Ner family transcriptional regulator
MHREDIKAAVRKRGTTLKALALAGGLSESACRKALDVPCPRGEALIAAFLNLPIHEIWPDRYDTRGGRRFTKVNNTPRDVSAHGQIRAAG